MVDSISKPGDRPTLSGVVSRWSTRDEYHLLYQRREPRNQCKCLAPVSVLRNSGKVACILLVESQPNPGRQPSELYDYERTLEPDDAHHR